MTSLRDASGLVNYVLVNNSLIVQSGYIDKCQASIHVVLNCILISRVHVKRAEIEVCKYVSEWNAIRKC